MRTEEDNTEIMAKVAKLLLWQYLVRDFSQEVLYAAPVTAEKTCQTQNLNPIACFDFTLEVSMV